MSHRTLALFLAVAATSVAGADGRIIAIGDEWTFSDPAFKQEPAAAAVFALNCAELLTGSSGTILAYSSNVAFSGTSLAALLAENGYELTVSTAAPFTLDTLMQYDAVWLAGPSGSGPSNAQALVDYVHAGGNVLVSAATGQFGSAGGEAAAWAPFLGEFGLEFGGSFFPVPMLVSVTPGPSSNPALQGVTSVVWGYGQTAFETTPTNLLTDTIVGDFEPWGMGDQPIIATYLPACSSDCPADLDGNFVVGAADLGILLGAWGQSGGAPDITCDGLVDAADLGALLGAWGACPR